jgi:NitT/TauT family transport system substrate-binding protein
MKRIAVGLVAVTASLSAVVAAQAETKIRFGVCARTISSALSPLVIAEKMGWYAKGGLAIELIPLPGSTDCVKNVATKEVPYALPSVEPLAIIRPQGVKAKIFYTAYQGNIYGIAVPAESPVKTIQDLKGKSIGLTSMASGGLIIARALVANAGMNPDTDVRIVVAGEGAQTAALVRSKQVDSLSQFDTQYAMVENAGVKLRMLDTKEIERFPSNGILALEERLQTNRQEAVTVAQGYAKGALFAMTNPEAAIRILWELYPQTKPTGKDEATALSDDVKVLKARMENWKLEKSGVTKWGESSAEGYEAYAEFMQKWGVTKEKVPGKDLITNDLIDEINQFDPNEIIAAAKVWQAK